MAEIGNVTVRVDVVITDEQYCEAMGVVRDANKRMDLLAAENAKLRELVVDMDALLNVFCVSEDGYGCLCPAWPDKSRDCTLRDLERRARELGIEMSDD